MNEPTQNKPQFTGKGECHGVNLKHRGRDDTHALVELFTEDDEFWHHQTTFSSSWLPELIELLQNVQAHIERHGVPDKYEGVQYGYKLSHEHIANKYK